MAPRLAQLPPGTRSGSGEKRIRFPRPPSFPKPNFRAKTPDRTHPRRTKSSRTRRAPSRRLRTFVTLTGICHWQPRGEGAGKTHLSKNPSANIVNRMENLRRTVNIGRLRGKGFGRVKEPKRSSGATHRATPRAGAGIRAPENRAVGEPADFLTETAFLPHPKKASLTSDLVRVGDPRPSPTAGEGQTRVPPYPLAGGKHLELRTWLILAWAEKESYRSERLPLGSPTPPQSLSAQEQLPTNTGPPTNDPAV